MKVLLDLKSPSWLLANTADPDRVEPKPVLFALNKETSEKDHKKKEGNLHIA